VVRVHHEEGHHGDVAVERGEQIVPDAALRVDDRRVGQAHLKSRELSGELRRSDQRTDRHAERQPDRHFSRDDNGKPHRRPDRRHRRRRKQHERQQDGEADFHLRGRVAAAKTRGGENQRPWTHEQ
jgi:hypothetical protein